MVRGRMAIKIKINDADIAVAEIKMKRKSQKAKKRKKEKVMKRFGEMNQMTLNKKMSKIEKEKMILRMRPPSMKKELKGSNEEMIWMSNRFVQPFPILNNSLLILLL